MGSSCSHNGRRRNAFKILTGKPTVKIPLGRSKHRWEGNIRVSPKEIGVNAKNWISTAQDRAFRRVLVNARVKKGFN